MAIQTPLTPFQAANVSSSSVAIAGGTRYSFSGKTTDRAGHTVLITGSMDVVGSTFTTTVRYQIYSDAAMTNLLTDRSSTKTLVRGTTDDQGRTRVTTQSATLIVPAFPNPIPGAVTTVDQLNGLFRFKGLVN